MLLIIRKGSDSELHLPTRAGGGAVTPPQLSLFPVADMRKALSRDTEKKSIIPLPHPVRPEDIE